MSEKQNLRDHKRRLLAELRRKLYKAFPYLPSDMRDKHRYKVLSCPSCQERKPMYFPRSVYEFFLISRIVFRGLASLLHYVELKTNIVSLCEL